jgi:multimeric flavodoxin WrbA
MKVLGIVAGPRRKGNTALLVEEVLAGAKEEGNDISIFYLGEMNISPLGDAEVGYSYPDDDFTKIMPHLETMGALVLGTPIYYDHVSSRAKLFIDRLYYYGKTHGEEYRKLFPDNVNCVNIISYGWDREDVYNNVLDWMNGRMTHYWNMKIIGNLKAYGTGSRPVKSNKEILFKARELGRKL